ncbi:hypothetical protein PoB_004996800 [Plakobranchus ocellatus]|uniref:Uncharacterized protein n=1 Tax=Plakobranchus ocellatus TaxID=259542 RepID=A0AAV4BW79_9GAST|nr:hypothetical protein PoB_004996800 [Plakobranchus ocellatus]
MDCGVRTYAMTERQINNVFTDKPIYWDLGLLSALRRCFIHNSFRSGSATTIDLLYTRMLASKLDVIATAAATVVVLHVVVDGGGYGGGKGAVFFVLVVINVLVATDIGLVVVVMVH